MSLSVRTTPYRIHLIHIGPEHDTHVGDGFVKGAISLLNLIVKCRSKPLTQMLLGLQERIAEVLRLMCLLSTTGVVLKPKEWDTLSTAFLQSYGYAYVTPEHPILDHAPFAFMTHPFDQPTFMLITHPLDHTLYTVASFSNQFQCISCYIGCGEYILVVEQTAKYEKCVYICMGNICGWQFCYKRRYA